VKYCLLALIPAALAAQSATVALSTDINGNRIERPVTSTSQDGTVTEVKESINGQLVPQERNETRVLSESSTEKVTETFDRKYDPTGRLVSTERTVTTEHKLPGGATSSSSSVSRSDVNGALQEIERRTVETQPTGTGTTESDVTIAKPSGNGGFETVEKQKITTAESASAKHQEQTVYLKSTSGDFVEKRRSVEDTKKSGDKTESSVANYEADYTGRIALLNQVTSTKTVSKDGKQVEERDIYANASDGVARDDQGGQKIKEQQTIVRTPGADGSVTETVSVRRPTLADESHLGPARQISETVCTGKCDGN
jgi:hypothetical protein